MKKICFNPALLAVIFFLFSFSFAGRKVKPVKKDWLGTMLHKSNDTTYVINFWATWCIPCVKELPAFEKLYTAYENKKVKVILVSLDYVKKIDEVVIPFLEKKKIRAEVVLLNESDPDTWMNSVDTVWGGAIPATLIYNNSTLFHRFLEKELTFELLDSLTQLSLQKK